MTTEVLKLQGDYLIQTRVNTSGASTGGSIVLDLGSINSANTGTVTINGNLVVLGDTLFGSVTNATVENTRITDQIVTLNAGEPTTALNGGVTGSGYTGLKLSRGRVGRDQDQFAAFMEWNENEDWQGFGAISKITGLFEFRVGKAGRPQYSGIKVNAIRIDENSASSQEAGPGQGPRLSIFGSDNPTAVMSVRGTDNYEFRVTHPDDIPNKAYVDTVSASTVVSTNDLIRGKSFVKIVDTFADGVTSEIVGVLNGDPLERLAITTGTVVLRLTPAVAQIGGIQIVNNEIQGVGANSDLRLATDGTGQIVLASPILFEAANIPSPAPGQIGLYSSVPGGGGTGIYFVANSPTGVVTSDEFVNRKKALIFSLIF